MPPSTPLSPGYDVNAHCEFHTGEPSHSIDDYKAFRFKVQDLIDYKAILFSLVGPNINKNPMSPNVDHPVNMIQESAELNLLLKVDMLKSPLLVVKE